MRYVTTVSRPKARPSVLHFCPVSFPQIFILFCRQWSVRNSPVWIFLRAGKLVSPLAGERALDWQVRVQVLRVSCDQRHPEEMQ